LFHQSIKKEAPKSLPSITHHDSNGLGVDLDDAILQHPGQDFLVAVA
jgi:hypothetical protein